MNNIRAAVLTGGPDVYDNIHHMISPKDIQDAMEWLFYRQSYLSSSRLEIIIEQNGEIVLNAQRCAGEWSDVSPDP